MDISQIALAPDISTDLLYLTKTDRVCAVLREAIITAWLKPGDHIRQQDIADQLNLSSTPVREALQKLQALGILLHTPHQGAQVPVPNRQTISEVFRVRAYLEGVAIVDSIERIDPDTLEKLEYLANKEMPGSLDEGFQINAFTPYRKANYEFHKLIYISSSMEVIPELIDNLWARSVVPDELYQFDCLRINNASKEHGKIVEAIEAKDVDLARKTLEDHVNLTRSCYLEFLDRSNKVIS
jgi:DNA-binding GntR family transcriptional regulator